MQASGYPTHAYTPVPARDPTAVMGRRVLAALVDTALYLAVFAFIWQSQASFQRLEPGAVPGETCEQIAARPEISQCLELAGRAYFVTDGEAVVIWLAAITAAFAAYGLLQGLTGWTVGKLLTRVRTVGEDGQVPGVGRSTLRGVLWMVDGPCGLFVPLGVVGFITALTTKGHRRVGDMAAKTFVVDAAAMGSPVLVPGLGAAAREPATPGAPPPWGPPPAEPQAPPSPQATPPPAAAGLAPPNAPAGIDQPGWAAPAEHPAAEHPAAEQSAQRPAAQQPQAGHSAYGPHWDDARGTYIHWDPNQGLWLQWDYAAGQWTVIPGQR